MAADFREIAEEQFAFRELLYQMTRPELPLRYSSDLLDVRQRGWCIAVEAVGGMVGLISQPHATLPLGDRS
jgi:hypothetical protein